VPVPGEGEALADLAPLVRAVAIRRYGWACRVLRCSEDDLAQIAMLGALRAVRTWNGRRNRAGWVLSLAGWAIREALRDSRRQIRSGWVAVSDLPGEVAEPVARDDWPAVVDGIDARAALLRVPDHRLRRMLVRRLAGETQAEVGAAFGVTAARVCQMERAWVRR